MRVDIADDAAALPQGDGVLLAGDRSADVSLNGQVLTGIDITLDASLAADH